IESWTIAYVWHSLVGTFKGVSPTEFFPNYLGMHDNSLFSLPVGAFAWFVGTLCLNVWILSRGLEKGVEIAAKIGMPLLFLFAAILAVRGLLLEPGVDPGVVESPLTGLNFVWQPQASGLANPSVWLAAAGQVFFTLSVGMGSIHCYAAYLRRNDDIALNAASAGWMNEFVEVILGSAILIPIATAYLGLAAVQTSTGGGSGFSLGFLTLPTLFNNWGWFAPVAGALWFGLLFFAGITSSLAMGQPIVAFLEDELGWQRRSAALAFGGATFALGFVCVWLYPGGAFDEFDFWSGTFSLVVFALAEAVIFSFIFGIEKGWTEITRGADLKIPRVFRWIIRWVTPAFLLAVFLGALFKPEAGDWGAAFSNLASGDGWSLAPDSVIGKVFHVGDGDYRWFDDAGRGTRALVQDASRMVLMLVFLGVAGLVWKAWRRPGRAEGRKS
ncbi:MAG: sodium:calcium symporter, partial [Acidobacteria bacterium]|nr:sodium:calcium symporter [Acidobacteriota bacterium]